MCTKPGMCQDGFGIGTAIIMHHILTTHKGPNTKYVTRSLRNINHQHTTVHPDSRRSPPLQSTGKRLRPNRLIKHGINRQPYRSIDTPVRLYIAQNFFAGACAEATTDDRRAKKPCSVSRNREITATCPTSICKPSSSRISRFADTHGIFLKEGKVRLLSIRALIITVT